MTDAYDNMVGIRLRSDSGLKWAVTGSHQGCFVPAMDADQMALVAEGPTDTAAGLSLGFYCVGRPSCSGGMNDLRNLFRRRGVRRCVIVSDNDGPGLRGSEMFSRQVGIPNCIVVLPAKDLRSFVGLGGDKQLLQSMIDCSLWNK